MPRLLPPPLALGFCALSLAGCVGPTPPGPTSGPATSGPAPQLWPSPRIIVGRVVACDEARGFAFVELQADAPAESFRPDTELLVRSKGLAQTSTLRASTQLRGHLLGCHVVAGRPTAGAEVVWLPP